MKVSLNWLKTLVDLNGLTPEEIAHRLTFAGVEVESIERLASASNLVVGEVKTCENAPDSDHLHLTTVYCGPNIGVLPIVCGAPNVRAHLKVIVALEGAKLPGGTIKHGVIRGHESCGMLCSLKELGVEDKYLSEAQINGIEELNEGNPGDTNVLELLGLDDVILDLKLLANRSDLYSINNVAKEIETLFGAKANIKTPKHYDAQDSDFKVSSLTKKCSQFSAKVVEGIKVNESPDWMKRLLRASGIRSINSIVDIGNYVMLLTGQPLHMYDLDKLPAKELVVRDDIETSFIALDEKTYELKKGDICITSNGEVMCLGGVMGANACAVDENTKNIVIEAANFDFASVRRTSIRLNLMSDSSTRFIKGINPNQYEYVLDLTLELLLNICDAQKFYNTITFLESEYNAKEISFTSKYINTRLGTSFKDEEIIKALESAFIIVKKSNEGYKATIPSHRIDILKACDLSEEVIRILGFEHVHSELPASGLTIGKLDDAIAKKRIVSNTLRSLGLDEHVTYSLVNKKEIESFNSLNKNKALSVLHPLTDDHQYIRNNILPSLMNVLVYNVNHQCDDLAFFEISDLFDEAGKHTHLAIVLAGNDNRHHKLSNEAYSYYHMKGLVEAFLKAFNIDNNRVNIEYANDENYHPGRSAKLKLDGKVFAIFGELHPNTKNRYDINNVNAVVAEIDLAILFATRTGLTKMHPISKYPTIYRDLALVVKNDISYNEIVREIYKSNRELIKNVEVFDVYRGEHVEKGYVSLAIRISYNALERTLSLDEVATVENKVLATLEKKFAIILRK